MIFFKIKKKIFLKNIKILAFSGKNLF